MTVQSISAITLAVREMRRSVENFWLEQDYSQIYLATVTHLTAAISMYQKNGYRLTREEQHGQISVQHYLKLLVK